MTESHDSRRRYPRTALSVRVFALDFGDFEAQSINVGLGGMYVQTDVPIPVGSRLTIAFSLGGVAHRVDAEVRWVSRSERFEPGLGLQFLDLSESTRAALAEHIAAAVGD